MTQAGNHSSTYYRHQQHRMHPNKLSQYDDPLKTGIQSVYEENHRVFRSQALASVAPWDYKCDSMAGWTTS